MADKLKLSDVLFFLLRHGETASNQKNVYRSWSNDSDAQLDANGKRGAKEAGEYLGSIGAQIELIVADTLDRIVETCEIVASNYVNVRLEFVRALHPLNMGDWTGKSKDKYPVEPFLKDPSKLIPGGETVNDFNRRQRSIFEVIFGLAHDLPGGKILVGGHGSTVAYLYNHVFNEGQDRIGYEGLVDPAGIIAITAQDMIPLTKVRGKKPDKKESSHGAARYPADHQPGMVVPKGGSNCAKCEYLGEPNEQGKDTCIEKNFIEWNGSNVIPGEIDAYCSDWFDIKEKSDGN